MKRLQRPEFIGPVVSVIDALQNITRAEALKQAPCTLCIAAASKDMSTDVHAVMVLAYMREGLDLYAGLCTDHREAVDRVVAQRKAQ